MNSLAHIEINVSNLSKSKEFYNLILPQIGWNIAEMNSDDAVGFSGPDKTHLFLVQTEASRIDNQYHRKNVGLNHFAFRASSQSEVEVFADFLQQNNIQHLYPERSKDYSNEYEMEHYYAVFFEDPDRIKLEVVFMR